MTDDTETTSWLVTGPNVRGRKCGSCTLCCSLLPIKSVGKPGKTRCQHQFSKGCRIYADRPFDCRTFSCRWLMDETTTHIRRPDRVGYVIDPMLDTILSDDRPADVIQIWVTNPDAHRDPALRDWLDMMAQRYGVPALIRDSTVDSWLLVAPSLHKDDGWLEIRAQSRSEEEMADVRHAAMMRHWGGGA